MKPLIITGCQRSGTAYTAALITACGHWCSHERIFSSCHRNNLKPTTCEAASAAAPFLSEIDAHIVHQVRHPLDAIASSLHRSTFNGKMRPSAQWIEQYIQIRRRGDTQLDRVVTYWLRWNAMVAKHAHTLWRLENLTPKLVATTLSNFNRPTSVERATEAMRLIPNTVNTSDRTLKLTWGDLPNAEKVKEVARQYGYDVQGEV